MRVVAINRQPVELFKVLKFEGMVASGGEAKAVISEGRVLVNGARETRRSRKLGSGDIIEFGDEKIQLQLIDN